MYTKIYSSKDMLVIYFIMCPIWFLYQKSRLLWVSPQFLSGKINAVLEPQKLYSTLILKKEEPKKDKLEAIESDDEVVGEENLFNVLEEWVTAIKSFSQKS